MKWQNIVQEKHNHLLRMTAWLLEAVFRAQNNMELQAKKEKRRKKIDENKPSRKSNKKWNEK